jgi:hypothetical protein
MVRVNEVPFSTPVFECRFGLVFINGLKDRVVGEFPIAQRQSPWLRDPFAELFAVHCLSLEQELFHLLLGEIGFLRCSSRKNRQAHYDHATNQKVP